MPIRVRKNVWSLAQGDDTLGWYARAIEVMRQRPITDPASWRYMAAVHDIRVPGPGTAVPRHWRQCAHQNWFFLPWHRGYLACFEAMISEIVAAQGGPDDWALPYWDYTAPLAAQPNAHTLPPAFLGQRLANGNPNPLWAPRAQAPGGRYAFSNEATTRAALNIPTFTSRGVRPGFGGPDPRFNTDRNDGAVEDQPHNWVHVEIGGSGGFMSSTTTAALDPIFWLHHCNIDRLWEMWRNGDGGRAAPGEVAWRDADFAIPRSTTGEFIFSCKEMLDCTAVLHGYRYDDVAPASEPVTLEAAEMAMAEFREPDLIGASTAPVALEGAQTRAAVSLRGDLAPRGTLESAAPTRFFLQLEAITGTGVPGNFRVLVAKAGSGAPPLAAGSFSTFGLELASDPGTNHGKLGLSKVFDITDLAPALGLGAAGDGTLEVTFEPLPMAPIEAPEPDSLEAADMAQPEPSIQVGRINVFRE